MSQLLATLHGIAPNLSGVATIFRVEKYRDKPRFEAEAARLKPALPAYVPKCINIELERLCLKAAA